MAKKKAVKAILAVMLAVMVSTLVYSAEIHEAAMAGDVEKVKAILEKDPSQLNAYDEYREFSPLHIAALNDQKEVAAFLIEKGADVNLTNSGKISPLLIAAALGHTEIARRLIQKGADVNVMTRDNFTPLYLAAAQGRLEIVRLLIEKGAKVNAKCEKGQTALYIAAQNGHGEIVKLLLEKGADPSIANDDGLTPADIAYLKDAKVIVKIFEARGIKVDQNRLKQYQVKEKQSEAKQNLGAIFTCEIAYFGEMNTFGNTFNLINWAPEGNSRYAYFLGNDVIQPKVGGPYQLPPGYKSEVSYSGFTAVAVGNIDDDATLDVWTMNDRKELKNVVNDAAN